MLTLPQFRATKRECADIGAELGFTYGDDDKLAGWIYDHGCYIEHRRDDSFGLLIGRMEWAGDDLAKLERILWCLHYVAEAGEADDTLGRETLDDYVAGFCDAFNVECDGDYFGHMFSGKDEWHVDEADRILDAYLESVRNVLPWGGRK